MSNIHEVVERHVRESALQLRRIDEAMAKARHSPAAGSAEIQALLGEIQAARDRLVQELDKLTSAASGQREDAAGEAVDAKSIFASVGLQFEKALAAVFVTSRR